MRGKEDEEGGEGTQSSFFFTICGNTIQHTNREVIGVEEIAIQDRHGLRH